MLIVRVEEVGRQAGADDREFDMTEVVEGGKRWWEERRDCWYQVVTEPAVEAGSVVHKGSWEVGCKRVKREVEVVGMEVHWAVGNVDVERMLGVWPSPRFGDGWVC